MWCPVCKIEYQEGITVCAECGSQLKEGTEDGREVDIFNNPSKNYVKKADEYKDVKYSGMTFIISGLIGIAYLVLCKTGILPLAYSGIVFVLLLCMFAAFIAGGFASVIKSKKIKEQISEEENMTREIKLWLDENITDGIVRSWKDADVTDEESQLPIP